MTALRVVAPSRLHFGLLASGPRADRQFGGLGLMIDDPGLEVSAEPSPEWRATGPLADRVLRVAGRVAGHDLFRGAGDPPAPALAFAIHRAPPEHVGLGTGTQLGLAVASLIARHVGLGDLPAADLATLAGRGARSGVGLHGFAGGGLVVEGGHRRGGDIPPLLCRMAFPPEWSVLVVIPPIPPGLHGPDELSAFAALPPIPEAETDRLCRLVLLGILPAVAERDLIAFGASLSEVQHRVGSWFAPAQGGVWASPRSSAIVDWLRAEGLHGVGQSSWGPALYGFTEEGPEWRASLEGRIRDRFDLGAGAFWTSASRGGASPRFDPCRATD